MQVITINKYLRKVKLSEARLKKYYLLGKNHPKAKKYLDTSKYNWQDFAGKKYLVDLSTGERVVANPKAEGTPRIATINGQAIYNGSIKEHTRAKILSDIKAMFMPYIDKMDTITSFPIRIEAEIHDTILESGSLWDVDNRAWPYIKAFQDCLTGNKDKNGKCRCKQVIPDDNILFLVQPPVPKFIPVDDTEDRKLVFKILKEEDKRITQNKSFKALLKEQVQ